MNNIWLTELSESMVVLSMQGSVRLKMAAFTYGMGAALRKPQQNEPKLLETKSLCYAIVKNVPRVLLPHSEAEKT